MRNNVSATNVHCSLAEDLRNVINGNHFKFVISAEALSWYKDEEVCSFLFFFFFGVVITSFIVFFFVLLCNILLGMIAFA